MYTYIYTHIHIDVYMHRGLARADLFLNDMHTSTHTRYTRACMHAYIHMRGMYLHVCMYACMHTKVQTCGLHSGQTFVCKNIYIYICMYMYTHTYMHTDAGSV